MKHLIAAAAALLILTAALSSCSGCSGSSDRQTDSTPTFVKADTAMVLELAESYLNHVRDKDYDGAVSMLCVIENDSVKPLTEDMRQSIMVQQRTFPVINYRLTDMEFVDANRVKVTYAIEFFEKEPGSSMQNTISITFAPQRINGDWYLELMDRQLNGTDGF
mgnify:CR=1 FL=1